MDSMRSLNTSLPRASPQKHQAPEPPEQLLQAFKAAALSVTTLYKTAALDQTTARSEGYQDALDDLLSFLDRENIGLSDGEGWRIRGWATERLGGRDAVTQNMESDEEIEKQERASSPLLQRTQSATNLSTRASSPTRSDSAPLAPIIEHQPTILPPSGTFTFRSSHPYPQDTDMGTAGHESSESSRTHSLDASVVSHTSHIPSPITISRPSRSLPRHNNSNRHNTRGASTIGRGAGQKRKINLGEFFDIGNFGPGHGRDGFGGGGKRGRSA